MWCFFLQQKCQCPVSSFEGKRGNRVEAMLNAAFSAQTPASWGQRGSWSGSAVSFGTRFLNSVVWKQLPHQGTGSCFYDGSVLWRCSRSFLEAFPRAYSSNTSNDFVTTSLSTLNSFCFFCWLQFKHIIYNVSSLKFHFASAYVLERACHRKPLHLSIHLRKSLQWGGH